MAGNEAIAQRRQVALDHVEVGTADPARAHAHEELVARRRRNRNVFGQERRTFDGRLALQHHGAHRAQPPARSISFFARVRCGASTICPLKRNA